jgi:hypothetical protein
MAGKFIDITPTPFLTYLADGRALDLPLVKSNRQYAKPHWLPVAIGLGDAAKEAGLPNL